MEDRRENGMKGRLAQWLRRLGAQGAALICVALALCCFAAEKEGYHMDELLSFQLSNAQFNPWIVPTQPVGRLAKFVQEEIRGESFGETVGNLADTVRDVVENRGASRLLQYRADVYPEPVWIGAEQFHDYITVGEEDAFSYLSVYFNVKDDNHPPLHFMLLHTMSSLFRDTVGPFQGCAINILAILGCCVCFFGLGALLERHGILPRGYGRAVGICAALLYGLSTGGIATALLIRMYGLLTFFCVALFYVHMKKWLRGEEQDADSGDGAGIFDPVFLPVLLSGAGGGDCGAPGPAQKVRGAEAVYPQHGPGGGDRRGGISLRHTGRAVQRERDRGPSEPGTGLFGIWGEAWGFRRPAGEGELGIGGGSPGSGLPGGGGGLCTAERVEGVD